MKSIAAIAILIMSLTAMAQEPGQTVELGGELFTYQAEANLWVHAALGEAFQTTQAFSAVRGDAKWRAWQRNGDEVLQRILELGPNVAFRYRGEDGRPYTYGVFADKNAFVAAVGAEPAKAAYTVLGMSPTAMALIGTAGATTKAVVEGTPDARDDVSPLRDN